MADQTTVALFVGFWAMPGGAILFHKITDLTMWISLPVGGVLGLVLVAGVVFVVMEMAGSLWGQETKPDRDDDPPEKTGQ